MLHDVSPLGNPPTCCVGLSLARRSFFIEGTVLPSVSQSRIFPVALERGLDHLPAEPWREQLDESIVEAAQPDVAANREPRCVGLEGEACRDRGERGIAQRVEGHLGDDADADAQAEFDIGLDNVRVDGGEHDVRCTPRALEGAVDARSAGEGRVVGDQWPLRERGDRDGFPRPCINKPGSYLRTCQLFFYGTF